MTSCDLDPAHKVHILRDFSAGVSIDLCGWRITKNGIKRCNLQITNILIDKPYIYINMLCTCWVDRYFYFTNAMAKRQSCMGSANHKMAFSG